MTSSARAWRADLRGAIRGGRALVSSGRPYLVQKLFVAIGKVAINTSKYEVGVLKKMFPASCIENRIKQIVTKDYSKIYIQLLNNVATGRTVSLSLPSELLEYLETAGVSIDWPGSRKELRRLSRQKFAEAVVVFGILLCQFGLTRVCNKKTNVFLDISPQLVSEDDSNESYTYFGWFRKEFENNDEVTAYIAANSSLRTWTSSIIKHCRFPYPPCSGPWRLLVFALRSTWSIVRAACLSLVGDKNLTLLLRDEIEATYLEVVPDNVLAGKYVLHTGSWHNKPLWLVSAERRGSEVLCCHYSANMVPFQHKFQPGPKIYPIPNWHHQVVWTKLQERYLGNHYKEAQFTMVRYIDFEDCEISLPENKGDFQVAVFDVSPVRSTFSVQLGLPPGVSYYTTENVVDFRSGINDCAARFPGVKFLFKGKRIESRKRLSKGSLQQANLAIQNERIIFLDERISARRVIEQSDAVISMPFTSPSMISDRLGKPSAFFDPTQSVKLDDIESIPVFGCVNEVCRWLRGLTTHSADRKQAPVSRR